MVQALHVLLLIPTLNLDVTDGFRSRSLEWAIGGDHGKIAGFCGRENHMLTVQDNATVVRSLYEAFNQRNIDKSLSLVTDDVKWMNLPFNVNFSGRAGYREYLENWTQAMPDCKVEVVNVVAAEEWTAVEFIGRGTHTGPLAGPQGTIPATHKKLEMKFCEVLRVRDGQIALAHLYFDAATMLRQLGLLPQITAPGQPLPSGR
jgi:steroid delta-isomerase-like uncharacterized protein